MNTVIAFGRRDVRCQQKFRIMVGNRFQCGQFARQRRRISDRFGNLIVFDDIRGFDRNEIDLFVSRLTDINVIAAAFQFQENDVFQNVPAVGRFGRHFQPPQGAKNIAHYIAHGSEGMEKDARVYDDERRLIPTEKLNETIDAYDLEQRRKNNVCQFEYKNIESSETLLVCDLFRRIRIDRHCQRGSCRFEDYQSASDVFSMRCC